MRIELYRKETIIEFKEKHANAKVHFENFLALIDYADWTKPLDITATFNGNLLNNERVVFDLGGNGRNAFRIVCHYRFRPHKNKVYLYVVWLGTHEEYNSLSKDDNLTVWKY